ncbi:Tn3 family transposase [Streptomyces sp. DSM 40473]|uniref:Tn3 family transposase n=1 Tax=Streptomyces hesseae TaxID=3075519 RepID=A0ABU2SYD7_9ACTN|nr:Tn3 family transposase [Streptomyces sp. DSM 40473]MDT0454018.1 Tn3 family transposase [Streptomyces sp. DSM 40473]
MRNTLALRYNTVKPFLALLGETSELGAATGGKRVLAVVKRLPALARRRVNEKPLLFRALKRRDISLFILDALLNLDGGVKPEMVATDNASYSDMAFGIIKMLGYRFSPRFKDLEDQRFWKAQMPGGEALDGYGLAARVWKERRQDLESRTGRLMGLFFCAKVTGPHAHPQDPCLELARKEAARLVDELAGC